MANSRIFYAVVLTALLGFDCSRADDTPSTEVDIKVIIKCPTEDDMVETYNKIKEIAPDISNHAISKKAVKRITRLNLEFKNKSFGKQCRLSSIKDHWPNAKIEEFEAKVDILVAKTEAGFEESLLSKGF